MTSLRKGVIKELSAIDSFYESKAGQEKDEDEDEDKEEDEEEEEEEEEAKEETEEDRDARLDEEARRRRLAVVRTVAGVPHVDERRKHDNLDEATKGNNKRARVEEEELPTIKTGKNTLEKCIVQMAVCFGIQPVTIAGPSKAKEPAPKAAKKANKTTAPLDTNSDDFEVLGRSQLSYNLLVRECHEGVQRPPSLLAESVATWEVWVEPWSLQRALRHKATQPSGGRNR